MTGEPYCTWGHRLVERVPLVTAEEAPIGIHGHAAQARWPSPGLGFFGPIQARSGMEEQAVPGLHLKHVARHGHDPISMAAR